MTSFTDGNQIQLLRNGAEYFPALLKEIERATQDIYIQTYIYQEDATGVMIGNALKQAVIRGVNVNLLLDGFGSKDLPKIYVDELEQAGVQVIFYRPKISPWSLKKQRLRRLHHKIVVIDGRVGFLGGINIIDDFDIPNNAQRKAPPRVDYAVKIEGNLLPALSATVQKLWHRIAWIHLRRIKAFKHSVTPRVDQQSSLHQNQYHNIKAALVVRDNVLHRRDIEDAYLVAIEQAQSEIIIANAYFVPGRRFRLALLAAARRGVKVRLLLQGRMEYLLMFATHAFYGKFLRAGIEIYEYHKSFMHSKVAVIDRHWATVGSSNIDPFSLLLAREANIVVKDDDFANELRSDIEKSIHEGAVQIDPHQWANGSILRRFASWVSYGLVRAFLGLIGHSSEK